MCETKIFNSERLFEVWQYSVSHRQLLLRSNKSNLAPTRIEVLFKDIAFMMIVPTLKGLAITACEPGKENLPAYLNIAGAKKGLYRIDAEGFVGYVIAGSVITGEDELEYYQPSGLLPGIGI